MFRLPSAFLTVGSIKYQEWQTSEVKHSFSVGRVCRAQRLKQLRKISVINLSNLSLFSGFPRSALERRVGPGWSCTIRWVKEHPIVSSAALLWLCGWMCNVWYHGRVCEPFIQASGRTEPFRGAFQRVDSFLKLWKYFVYFLKLLCLLTSHFRTAVISVSRCVLSGGGHFVQRLLYL